MFRIRHKCWKCNQFQNLNPDACQLYRSHYPRALFGSPITTVPNVQPKANGDGLIIMEFHKDDHSKIIEIWFTTFKLSELGNIRQIVEEIVILSNNRAPFSLEIAGYYAKLHYSRLPSQATVIPVNLFPFHRHCHLPVITANQVRLNAIILNLSEGFVYFCILNEIAIECRTGVIMPGVYRVPTCNFEFISQKMTFSMTKIATGSAINECRIIPQIFAQILSEFNQVVVGVPDAIFRCIRVCNLTVSDVQKLTKTVHSMTLSNINYQFIRNHDLAAENTPHGLYIAKQWNIYTTKLLNMAENNVFSSARLSEIGAKLAAKVKHHLQRIRNDLILCANLAVLNRCMPNIKISQCPQLDAMKLGSATQRIKKNDIMVDVYGNASIVKKMYDFGEIGMTRNILLKKSKTKQNYNEIGKTAMMVKGRVQRIVDVSDTCGGCHMSLKSIKAYRCSRCLVTVYCSKKCAKFSWKNGHKSKCQLF